MRSVGVFGNSSMNATKRGSWNGAMRGSHHLMRSERVEPFAGLQAEKRLDVLIGELVVDADHGALGHGRVLVQHALHLPGRDVLAAAAQAVLLAAGEIEEALVVGIAEVAGAQPAVLQRRRGRVRVGEIRRS